MKYTISHISKYILSLNLINREPKLDNKLFNRNLINSLKTIKKEKEMQLNCFIK